MAKKLDAVKTEVISLSDRITKDTDKDNLEIARLTAQNKMLRDQINQILRGREEASWAQVEKEFALESADNFFGKDILTLDECVKQYLTEYKDKISEYIEDLRNKRGNIDNMDNGLEGIILEGHEDEQMIDPRNYLEKYKKMVNVSQEGQAGVLAGLPALPQIPPPKPKSTPGYSEEAPN